jgi:hypothetical protein
METNNSPGSTQIEYNIYIGLLNLVIGNEKVSIRRC